MEPGNRSSSLLLVDADDILAKLRESPSSSSQRAQPSQFQANQSHTSPDDGSRLWGHHDQDPPQLSATASAPGTLEEEEMVVEDISLKNLVIDVRHPDMLMMEGDDAGTKSRSTGADIHGNGGSLADEPTHECAAHKKHRKERFLILDPVSGEWNCRDGATCKAASSESKREKKRNAAVSGGVTSASMMSYGEASNNASNVSIGAAGGCGGSSTNLGQQGRPVAGSNGQQVQTMFLCSVHRKLRSARNMTYTNSTWVCLPHMQCQMPSSERNSVQQPLLQPQALVGMHGSSSLSHSDYASGNSNNVSGSASFHRAPPPTYFPHQQQQPYVIQQPQQQQGTFQQHQGAQPQLVYVLPSGQQPPYLQANNSSGAFGPKTSPDHLQPQYSGGYSQQQQPQHPPPQQQQVLYVIQQPASPSAAAPTQQHQHQAPQHPYYFSGNIHQVQQPGQPGGAGCASTSMSQQSSMVYQSSSGSDAFSLYSPQQQQQHHGGASLSSNSPQHHQQPSIFWVSSQN